MLSELLDCLVELRVAAHDVITEWAEGDMTTMTEEITRLRAALRASTLLLES